MIGAILLAVVTVAGGAAATYLYDEDAGFPSRLGYGAASGFAALALIGFVLANLLPIEAAALAGRIVVAAPLLTLAGPGTRARLAGDLRSMFAQLRAGVTSPSLRTTGPIVYSVGLVVFLWLVFDRVIVEDQGALLTSYVNNLGDLPFHLQVTSSFAYSGNFPPEDPTYAGTGFAYPYLSDFVAAVFVSLGASLRDAFFLENLVLALALVVTLARFTVLLTRDAVASFVAPILLLFSGGLGWLAFLDDARSSGLGVVGTLSALTRDYTIVGEGPYRWGNAITTLLVTQRSLLFGLPIALIVFALLWKLINGAPATGWRPIAGNHAIRLGLAAGLLTGCLPLIHAHSFVVVFGTAFLLGVVFLQWRERRWMAWSVYVVVALALALPAIWWSTHDSIANAGTFFGFELGWDHGQENIAWFWLLNTGLFIPLIVIGYLWREGPPAATRQLLLFSSVFLVWFLVPNVMKLAPWVWDNIKVLFYWFVGFLPLVALVIARLLRRGPGWQAAGIGAILVLTLAGGIDVYRALSRQADLQEFDADGIAIARLIREETPQRSLILHAPTYNPPVFLTGRRSLLGYTGYIWAHGLPFADRETDIRKIYAGEPGAADLLASYGVDFVLVGPIERGSLTVNDAFFEQYPIVGEAGAERLYDVAQP